MDCEYLDRLGDVFQFLQTEGSETESKLSADLIIDGPGYGDAAGLADALEPLSDYRLTRRRKIGQLRV